MTDSLPPFRDRIEITLTVIEEKNGSDFEDFSKGSIIHTAEEKSSKDEAIFPSRTVTVISRRSLKSLLIGSGKGGVGKPTLLAALLFKQRALQPVADPFQL